MQRHLSLTAQIGPNDSLKHVSDTQIRSKSSLKNYEAQIGHIASLKYFLDTRIRLKAFIKKL